MSNSHSYSDSEKKAVYKAIAQRRDMRHFNGKPLESDVLQKIIVAAHMAPSVGLMQPWRFIRITDKLIRQSIFNIVDKESKLTSEALGQRKKEFLKLKVEGVMQCSELLIAALPDGREEHIFGRRTMPEMDLASLSCAI